MKLAKKTSSDYRKPKPSKDFPRIESATPVAEKPQVLVKTEDVGVDGLETLTPQETRNLSPVESNGIS